MSLHDGGCSGVCSPGVALEDTIGGLSDARGAFLLVAVTFGVILLDVLLGGRVILVELLVAGPLIAATRATVTETAIAAALALAASIPLGLASDAFFEAARKRGGGRGDRRRARRGDRPPALGRREGFPRLRVQYGVARVLAESTPPKRLGHGCSKRSRRRSVGGRGTCGSPTRIST